MNWKFTASASALVAATVGAIALAARQRGPLGRIGATGRKGPRTGAVEVNPAVVNERVDELLREMQPCWSKSAGTFLQPDRAAAVQPMTVHDAATGEPRRVNIILAPKIVDPDRIGGGMLATEPVGFYGDRVRQTILVEPNALVCAKVPVWRRLFRDVLTHELAHASDPALILEAMGRRKHRYGRPGSRAYYNSAAEMVAHLAEVKDQLRRFGAEVDWSRSPRAILLTSEKYQDIEPMLTETNRRRFLKMAARLKTMHGGLGGRRSYGRRQLRR